MSRLNGQISASCEPRDQTNDAMSNTKTIAKNTGWYSVENIVSAVVTVITSIAIARTLGPTKMGYIVYVSYVASVVGNLGSLGIPAATRKYMAEFIGMGDKGTARLIFFRTLALQAGLAYPGHTGHCSLGVSGRQRAIPARRCPHRPQHLALDGQLRPRAGQQRDGKPCHKRARIDRLRLRLPFYDLGRL